MPRKKNLKRLVRARMAKTGESYVAALVGVRRPAPGVPGHVWRPPATPELRRLERLLARLCGRLGCSVTPAPSVPGEWAAPALLIEPGVGAPFYLDAVVAPDHEDARAAGSPRLGRQVESAALLEALVAAGAGITALPGTRHPERPAARAVARMADLLVDPDLPYVVAVAAASPDADASVIELWTGAGGPRLQVSGVLVVETRELQPPLARLYHHPQPRRALTAAPLLRLPQAVWAAGRYVHGDGESLASLLGGRS